MPARFYPGLCVQNLPMPLNALPPAVPIAILSALLEEQHGLMELLQQPYKVTHAGRDFWLGDLHGVGFMEPPRGQPGVAPNGVELHPVIYVHFR